MSYRFLPAGADEVVAGQADGYRSVSELVAERQVALEALLHTVWSCEADWRLQDRLARPKERL